VAIRQMVNYVPAMNKVPKAFDTTRKVAQFDLPVLIFPLDLFLNTTVECVHVCTHFHFSCVIFLDSSPRCGQERMFCDWFYFHSICTTNASSNHHVTNIK